MPDKRQYVRTEFCGPVRIMHPRLGDIQSRIRDLSDGGVYLFTNRAEEFALQEVVRIQAMDLDDAPELDARVVRIESAGIALIYLLEE